MSIEYKVTVAIPADVERVYGSDDWFKSQINERLKSSSFDDISCGNIIAEFDTMEDAEKAEAELTELMDEYESSYELTVAAIKKAFYAIDELVACYDVSRLKKVLSGIETSQSFVTFLIDQAIANSREQDKANGDFEYIED